MTSGEGRRLDDGHKEQQYSIEEDEKKLLTEYDRDGHRERGERYKKPRGERENGKQ
jgi:hypothetical protein